MHHALTTHLPKIPRTYYGYCALTTLGVYNMHAVSTTSRPRLLVADSVHRLFTAFLWCTGKRRSTPGFLKGAFGALILALRFYNMHTVSTISRRRLLVADSVYRLFTAFLCCAGKHRSRTDFRRGPSASSLVFALCVYNMHTLSTISRPCLHVADSVYRLFTAFLWCTGKRRTTPGFLKGAFGPLP